MDKKEPKTVRVGISLCKVLKRRMENVEEHVNWSALAARAFEDKLAEISRNHSQQRCAPHCTAKQSNAKSPMG